MRKSYLSVAAVALVSILAGCDVSLETENDVVRPTNAGDGTITLYPTDSTTVAPRIRRTTAGVPHISGTSLSSVSAGLGYAQAEDQLCVLADAFIKVRGERSAFFGPGPDDDNILSDFSYRALELYSGALADIANTPASTRAMADGFASGYNHFLRTNDPNTWPEACRNQPWVREIEAVDLLAYYRWLSLQASGELFTGGAIAQAVPPGVDVQPIVVGANTTESELNGSIAPRLAASPESMLWENRPRNTASNAWGIGNELSENGRGVLLTNPHFPYTGPTRFYQSHLTIPGELNVMGAGLLGAAIPLISFNDNLGWAHTNSESMRFTVYQLQLDPDNPMAYIKDGVSVPITERSLQVEVFNGSDTPTVLERSAYYSEYGPMLSMAAITGGALPRWGEDNLAFTYRDANANINILDTWLEMAQAANLAEFQAVFEDCGTTLWTNSTYADKEGNAYYIDSSSVPFLSAETLAVVEPKLLRQDFVQNSNSSHWATNPAEFLNGYSPLFGPENSPLNARTRLGLSMLQNPTETGFGETSPAGDDGKFNAQEVLQAIWNNRSFYAELFLPEVRERCALVGDTPIQNENSEPRSVAPACTVLTNWSGNYNSDAVGAHVFRVLMAQLFTRNDIRLAVDFDPANPVNTPSTLESEIRGTAADPVMQSLLTTTEILEDASIDLNATLGSVQTYTPTGGAAPGGTPQALADALPWHGGSDGVDGVFNAIGVVGSTLQENTLLPRISPPLRPNTGALAVEPGVGWRVGRGTSWHHGLQFNDDGPQAWGLLSYGQSTNPAAPWYAEQSSAYSNKEPRQLVFKEADIAAAVLPGYDNEMRIDLLR